jgi:phage FluMu protein Com
VTGEINKVELVGWIVSECPHCWEKEVVCWPVEGGSSQDMRCSRCKGVFQVQEYFDLTIEIPPRRSPERS